MAVYRQRYKVKATGETRQTKDWYVRLTDPYNRGREIRIRGFTDKRSTESFERNLKQLIDCRLSGSNPNSDLERWIDNLDEYHRKRIHDLGVIRDSDLKRGQSILQHLDEYGDHLLAKGCTRAHGKQVVRRCRRIIGNCDFRNLHDIHSQAVETFLAKLREGPKGIAAGTSNRYLSSMKSFCNWLVRHERLDKSPLAHLQAINEWVDKRHPRRALTADEIGRLLITTENGPFHHRLTGPERALLYRLAMETGLRWSELHSLRKSSFDFTSTPVTLTIDAACSKHRREDVLPVRSETAKRLSKYLEPKGSETPAFPLWRRRGAQMLQKDLAAAGIPYRTEKGYADFHALRHSFLTALANAGVHPKITQMLARHSDLNLTLGLYTHTDLEQHAAALDLLPFNRQGA